ncbi:hypothetical protein DXN05_17290 [Deminuibacter soli]|uniref:Uncharacterized protein n=1 Tax=Deminuibacter soli TaxID=2291815 RepID=A0A3E1NG67_9BACT|nr:hypothetical protein DXN05_17290 [Deminuibacter soli]
MKQVSGGSSGGGCSSGPCTLTIQGSNGSWATWSGSCSSTAILGTDFFQCYCETGLGPVNVTSNGGVSRCGNFG